LAVVNIGGTGIMTLKKIIRVFIAPLPQHYIERTLEQSGEQGYAFK